MGLEEIVERLKETTSRFSFARKSQLLSMKPHLVKHSVTWHPSLFSGLLLVK